MARYPICRGCSVRLTPENRKDTALLAASPGYVCDSCYERERDEEHLRRLERQCCNAERKQLDAMKEADEANAHYLAASREFALKYGEAPKVEKE